MQIRVVGFNNVIKIMKDHTLDRGPRQLRRQIMCSGTTQLAHQQRHFIISIIKQLLSMGMSHFSLLFPLECIFSDSIVLLDYFSVVFRYSSTYIATDISYNQVS